MRGIIAAGGPETAQAGEQAFQRGGNAVDAAVSAMFTAFLAEPCLTSPGGAGLATLYDPKEDEAFTFDFFAQVPGLPASKISSEGLDFQALEVDFGSATQVFHVGRGATAVPGCLPGLLELHRRYGKLPLKALLEPAKHLAEHGAPTSKTQAGFFSILEPILTYTQEMARIFAPKGHISRTGELVRSRRFADVLEGLERGEDPLTEGSLRDHFLAEWGPPRGLITALDLDAYHTVLRPALRVPYRDAEIILPAYPSVGGSLVAFALGLLGDLDALPPPESAGFYQALASALEASLLARREGPPFSDEASLDFFRDPKTRGRYLEAFHQALAKGGEGSRGNPGLVPGNTTHLSTLDESGLAVSMTTSNGESCGVVLDRLGLAMNNFLGEEDINPRGWHQDPPGQRLPTMMCPTLARLGDGSTVSFGTGGSNRIRSAILQTTLHLVDHGLSPRELVETPRLHRELDGCYLEAVDLPPESVEQLSKRYPGIRLFPERGVFFGGVHLAQVGPHGELSGSGDPRRGGVVRIHPG